MNSRAARSSLLPPPPPPDGVRGAAAAAAAAAASSSFSRSRSPFLRSISAAASSPLAMFSLRCGRRDGAGMDRAGEQVALGAARLFVVAQQLVDIEAAGA